MVEWLVPLVAHQEPQAVAQHPVDEAVPLVVALEVVDRLVVLEAEKPLPAVEEVAVVHLLHLVTLAAHQECQQALA